MNSDTPNCFFIARVVPDGRNGDDLRVSLCLLPRAGADHQAGPIALERWPAEIAALFKDDVPLRLRVRGGATISTITARVTGFGSASGSAIWQKVLGGPGPSWPDLWAALRADQDAEGLTGQSEYDRSHVLSYPLSAPLAFLEKSFAAPGAGALAMLNADPNKRKLDTLAPTRMLVPSLHTAFLDLFTNAATPAGLPIAEGGRTGQSPAPIPKAILGQLGRRRADRADRADNGEADPATGTIDPIDSHWKATLSAALDGWKQSQASLVDANFFGASNGSDGSVQEGSPPADEYLCGAAQLAGLNERLDQIFVRVAASTDNYDATIDFGSAFTRSDVDDVLRQAFALYHLSTRRDLDASHGLAEDEEMTPPAIARRKLAAIVAQPVLARALGFTVDLTVKRADLPAGEAFFELALGSNVPGQERELWSATKITDDFFGPVPAAEYMQKKDPITGQVPRPTNGVVDLAQTTRAGARFRIAQIDVPLGLESWENAGRSRQNQSLQGDAAEASSRTPALVGGILELCDSHAGHAVLADIVSSDPKRSILFEEDLRAGFRMDVGIAGRGAARVAPERWRSLTEAEVRFDDLGTQAVRSDGWFEPIARLADTEEGKPKQVVANPVIARWGGDSHALAARGSVEAELQDAVPQQSDARRQISWLSPETDLALPAAYSYPSKEDPRWGKPLRLPPSRFGRAYSVGLRTALINGGGLSLSAASRAYTAEGMVPPEGLVQLRRFAEIQSPVVLVPDKGDALADADSLDDLAGEQVTAMLLREGGTVQPVRRFLAAPRVAFETIIAHGMLDGTKSEKPRGAYETYELDRVSGEFAMLPALNGRNAPTRESLGGSRGAVLRVGTSKPDQPWYPDPLAERCCLVFRRNGEVPLGFGQGADLDPMPLIVEINRRSQWPQAKPLEIELRAINGGVNVRGRMTSVGSASAPKVRIELARGESIDLVAWMIPTGPWALEEHAFFDRVPALADSIGRSQSDRTFANAASAIRMAITAGNAAGTLDTETWNALFARAPLPGLSTPVSITLTHAVKKPLLTPEFKRVSGTSRAELALVRPEPDAMEPAQAWASLVAGKQTPDLLNLKSGRNGSRAFVVGSVMIDRAATRQVELQLRWREFGPAALSKSDKEWIYQPKQRDWLPVGRVDLTQFGAGGAAERLDLTFDRDTLPRALNYDFGDTIARQVDVRVVALSRFAAFFEGQQPTPAANTDQYSSASKVESLWVPATARPTALTLKRFDKVPLAAFEATQIAGGYQVTRKPVIELRFADIDVSGEGELVGVVCPIAEQQDVAKLDHATGFGRFLSRQGHDPMFESGHVEPWFADRHFPGALKRELEMPYLAPGDAPNEPPKAAPVQVYGLRPSFDRTHGDWVLHLTLDSGQSYAPFVRLGLCRWQPNAIAGEELSTPVSSLHRVHPNRTVKAVVEGNDRLVVKVRGQAYRRTATPPGTPGDRWHRSAIELRLQYFNGTEWTSEIDPRTGKPLVLEAISQPSGSEAEWFFEMTLPRSQAKRHYAVWLEEYGLIVGDGEDEDTPAPVKFEQHFQCKIDMRRGFAV